MTNRSTNNPPTNSRRTNNLDRASKGKTPLVLTANLGHYKSFILDRPGPLVYSGEADPRSLSAAARHCGNVCRGNVCGVNG